MEIIRAGSRPSGKGPTDWFTGTVRIDPLFNPHAPERAQGASGTFEPGARTAWHTHPLGQTLVVIDGVGWTQIDGGPVQEFEAGDILLCPRDQRHWHGATTTSSMTHVAVQEHVDGTNVTWMQKVTDDEYVAGQADRRS